MCSVISNRFLDAEIMLALGMVYMQHWLCENNVTNNFLPHLDQFKAIFYVGTKVKGDVVVLGFWIQDSLMCKLYNLDSPRIILLRQ